MYNLYELVPVGGIVIFDDVYTHKEVRKFWNDFRFDFNLTERLTRIDHDSAWFRKTRAVAIDFAKKRHKSERRV